MKILAADDELHARRVLTEALKEALPEAEVVEFSKPSELLAYAKENTADLAFLDINMRGMTGIELAKKLKEIYPKLNIIFVTGYGEYARDAISLHASGYVMKPVTADKIRQELEDLRYPLEWEKPVLLRLQCFGNFDASDASGRPIKFKRSKAKELLAYLTYRRGAACTTREIAATLFEDEVYDEKHKSYTQQIISSLVSGLKAVGADGLIIRSYNSLALDTSQVDCDFYRMEEGKEDGQSLYTGEFMAQYSWAEDVAGYLDRKNGALL